MIQHIETQHIEDIEVPTIFHSSDQYTKDYASMDNPSLQVTADHQIKMVSAPVLKPGRGEVLLHIKATGICG